MEILLFAYIIILFSNKLTIKFHILYKNMLHDLKIFQAYFLETIMKMLSLNKYAKFFSINCEIHTVY